MSVRPYQDFLASKFRALEPAGFDVAAEDLHPSLFPFQRDLVRWALRMGRAALFCETGLGKSRQQVEWSRFVHWKTRGDVLILAPLAVAAQTVREGEQIGVNVTLCRDGADLRPGINITNYDRLHRFDHKRFSGVVLDESSCIKHHDSKTLAALIEAFSETRFKLCATATPAPNDFTELGTHAEFLGVSSRAEMLAEYFVHDAGETQTWRLKGHARAAFWQWVSSWGALVRKPSDLGYDDDGYDLPPLEVIHHVVPADQKTIYAMGLLFAQEAGDLRERRNARRASVGKRVELCAAAVNAEPNEQWIVWGDLNAETDALTKAVPGAVEVRGPDDPDEKEKALLDFADGRIRVLVTKTSIAGFGLNLQRCARMAFIGVSDSFESYYQAIRRSWRFGQTRPVTVHVFASEEEGSVVDNLRRKEADAKRMADELSLQTRQALRAEVLGNRKRHVPYEPTSAVVLPSWMRSNP